MAGVAIATTTLSEDADDLRMRLALRTVKEASKCGYTIVVVDGGSPEEALMGLRSRGAHLFRQNLPGMGASRRQAIAEAARLVNKNGVVIWMEPEKRTLITELHKAIAPILSKEADLVIPARKSMASYPQEQQYAEFLGNLAFRHITGHNLDVWFGPRVMNRRAVNYFLDYNGLYGDKWDSIFIPVLRMIKDGLRVISVQVNYMHPREQTVAESGIDFLIKRIEQLGSLVPAMMKEAKAIGLFR